MPRDVVFNEYGESLTHLTQWDINRKIVIKNFKYDDTPVVHFCNKSSDSALVVESEFKDGQVVAEIPNRLLMTNKDILIYICLYDSDKQILNTVMYFTLPVRRRPKPCDYIYTDNVEFIEIKELKSEIEKTLENAQALELQLTNSSNEMNSLIQSIQQRLQNGEFNGPQGEQGPPGKDAEPITIDTKLSETSTNPIANSAVAKVLGGGKLVGIETIYDYEDLMDFESKYWDIENDVPNYADDEFFILFVLDDIYDENGEYGDNECLLKKGLYFESNNEGLAVGEVSIDDFNAIVRRIESLEQSAKQQLSRNMVAHRVNANGTLGIRCSQFEKGISQIIRDGVLKDDTGNQLCWLIEGDLVFCSGYGKVTVISSNDGKIYTSKTENNSVHSSYLIDKTEAEQLVDDKLAEVDNSKNSSKWNLVEQWTNEVDDLASVKFDFAKNYSKIKVFVDLKESNKGIGMVFGRVNNLINNSVVTLGMSTYRYYVIDCEMLNGFVTGSYSSMNNLSVGSSKNQAFGHEINSEYINVFSLKVNTSDKYFPIGMSIVVYGVEV